MNDESPREPPTAAASPIHHSSFIIHRFDHPAFFGGVLISYLVAALILGAAAVNAWLWQSSGRSRPPGRSPPATRWQRHSLPRPLQGVPPAPLVGRVTVVSELPLGLGGCRRRFGGTGRGLPRPQVHLGKRAPGNRLQVRLASHLAGTGDLRGQRRRRRLSFPRQADGTVGPGGFRDQRTGFRGKPEIHPSSFIPQLLPAPPGPRPQSLASFVLRTPTATVASAAGELGVEVREPQACRVCVFAGQAELRFQWQQRKGDRHHLPERPGGCFAQMVPVPFFVLCENQSAETVQVGAEHDRQARLAAGVRRRLCPPDPEGGISENAGAGRTACRCLAQIDGSGNHRRPLDRDRQRQGYRTVWRGVAGRKGPNRRRAAAVPRARTVAVAPISRPANYSRSTTWP